MHKISIEGFLVFGIFTLFLGFGFRFAGGKSTANEGEIGRSGRGLYQIAQDIADKLRGFASEYVNQEHVDCEHCVHIKGLPGCVQSSLFEASRPVADPDMCLTLKVTFGMGDYLPEVPGEVRMGIRAPLSSPLRLWRYSYLNTCKEAPVVATFLSEKFGSSNMHIHEICGCATNMCNKYVGLFNTHPVFQI